tara:strand:- start:286 stop:1008 length:723 start_codon:yes stop_codon:yes gene_type:complete
MEYSTNAIVLKAIKYGETSLIINIYSELSGLQTVIVKGVRIHKKKKLFTMGMFLNLNILKVNFSKKKQTSIGVLKSAKVIYALSFQGSDIFKSSISAFSAELLNNSIKEEEKNDALYNFLEQSIKWLDAIEKPANFTIGFMIALTKFLGIYPDTSDIDKNYFDLVNGVFTDNNNSKECYTGRNVLVLKKFLGMKFDVVESVQINRTERMELLKLIVRYYQTHIQGFIPPKSLNILHEVFD